MASLKERLGDGCGDGLGVGRCSGEAVPLDAEIVLVHVYVEETIVAPVGAPRVASNPVLLAFSSDAVTNNRDLVVEQNEMDLLRVNGSSIVIPLEVVGDVNTTRDGTVLELSFHLVGSLDIPVLANVVANVRSDSCTVCKTVITYSRRRSVAVAADIDCGTRASNIVVSNIVHARRVDETFRHCELVDLSRVSSIARTSSVAVDDHLGIKSDW